MIDPNASDWSDLDLLTVDEATERLVAEIAVVEAEIDEYERAHPDDDGGSALESSRRRLRALRDRLSG